ncbi:MAG TPA: phosphoribosylanthranilate isomerase [Tepidisphaeraceae bacterium]|jgi:phosphoribosylanthranilate isomerase|nr:phosphoribosylanthranilate isomerase [Tepidisphaeraceae bacterium]
MPRTRVKICGVCRSTDAAAAARAGADAIGIVFDPNSKRCVSVDEAIKIVAAAPPFVTPVGLFVNTTPDEIRRILRLVPLAAVQLQGDERPELVAELKPIRIIKALHLAAGDTAMLDRWRTAIDKLDLTNLIGILLETVTNGPARGGTGILNNFPGLHAMQTAGNFAGLPPMIAAGGLTPANVGDVIRSMRPFAVDVSSGVESVLREKSAKKMEAFVRAVRAADGP